MEERIYLFVEVIIFFGEVFEHSLLRISCCYSNGSLLLPKQVLIMQDINQTLVKRCVKSLDQKECP